MPGNKNEKLPRLRINETEAVAYTGMSRSFLAIARSKGRGGPPYLRLGRAIRYDLRDLDEWMAERRVVTPATKPRASRYGR